MSWTSSHELEEIAPNAFAGRVKRAGIVNAMHDENFRDAVLATGRKKVIVAGITTEVCVVFPVTDKVSREKADESMPPNQPPLRTARL